MRHYCPVGLLGFVTQSKRSEGARAPRTLNVLCAFVIEVCCGGEFGCQNNGRRTFEAYTCAKTLGMIRDLDLSVDIGK